MTLEGRYYGAFDKVLECDDFDLVNQYIGAEGKDGEKWELLDKPQAVDRVSKGVPITVLRTLVYSIGRVKKETAKPQQPEKVTSVPQSPPKPLAGFPWTAAEAEKAVTCNDYTDKKGGFHKGCGQKVVWRDTPDGKRRFDEDGQMHQRH
jgi:hypothetical protein